ncbi:hypothetical protein [Flavihumibacter sp. CACIAM 22H1]|uniref:DUF6922 domain-containing protein n=1 Tax=Flavihumibacter sp. CACIAM 22H1 TaxID=1812911 RepID=UPI0007A7E37A|nr:hypothetical protein [Flavihumibacter sp. CACIAM 22H1]KYP13504.1 MAG: hypothetical protein A1D16_12825 [Flavihumibacter sp. CACIAM 22H1]
MESIEDLSFLLPGYAFWDVKRENLDFSRDKAFIVSRLFERGKLDDVLSVIVLYGKDETAAILLNNKYLNRQGLFLAHTLLGLPLQDFKAYATLKHD